MTGILLGADVGRYARIEQEDVGMSSVTEGLERVSGQDIANLRYVDRIA